MEMSALTKVLRGHLKDHLERAKVPNPNNPAQKEFYLIYLEEQLTFREAEAVIRKLEAFGDKTEITKEHVAIVTEFLENRMKRIQNTNGIYCIEVNGQGNEFCTVVAEFVANHLKDLVGGKSHFALLMPSVKSWQSTRPANNDIDMKFPHSFLLTDDNQYTIEVGYLKESKAANGGMSITHREGNVDRELSTAERNRIIAHTKATEEYYKTMSRLVKNVIAYEEDISVAKLALRDALSKRDYAKHGIKSSYGNTGDALLLNNLLNSINMLFANRDQLFDFMLTLLEPKQWGAFLEKMDDTVIKSLIQAGTTLKKTVNSDSIYTGDIKHDTAVLFCLAETYSRERKGQGFFTSKLAYLHRQSYNKPTKESAANAVKDFLVTRKLSEWDEFVKKQDTLLAGAIQDGTIGYISAQIKKIEEKRLSAVTQPSVSTLGARK